MNWRRFTAYGDPSATAESLGFRLLVLALLGLLTLLGVVTGGLLGRRE